jgi:hypothetical protein|tara:strand:- start:416 stop:913 length:498 start_codon:yes stop_codon:yes gene_type:complete
MKTNIYSKLYALQNELGAISKDATNPFYDSKYFDINSLIGQLKPLLQKHNLVLLQPINNNQVRTVIYDLDGGSVESSMELPTNLNAQKLGSAITYFRRYTLTSLLALQAVDDDGNLAAKLPMLYENVGSWNDVVANLKNGKVDMNYVKSKFDISKVENQLNQLNK